MKRSKSIFDSEYAAVAEPENTLITDFEILRPRSRVVTMTGLVFLIERNATTLKNWAANGMPRFNKTGVEETLYNVADVVRWIQKNANPNTGTSKDIEVVKLEKLSAEAKIRNLDFQERSGELVNSNDVERKLTDVMIRLRNRLRGISSTSALEVFSAPSVAVVESILLRAIDDALSELAALAGSEQNGN